MTATTTDPKTNDTPKATDATSLELARTKLELARIPKSQAVEAWELANRRAQVLANSSLVPKEYQGNVANCLIALQYADRIGADPMMVLQNTDVIHGRPSLRATFLIGTVNACGRFSPLRFRFEGNEGADDWGCRAVAKSKEDDEECVGELITIGMAKKEGWATKNGSKWLTMAGQMLRYRAATFWTRIYAPELMLGMRTSDEVIDTEGYDSTNLPPQIAPGNPKDLEAALTGAPAPTPPHDPVTGEVKAAASPPDLGPLPVPVQQSLGGAEVLTAPPGKRMKRDVEP